MEADNSPVELYQTPRASFCKTYNPTIQFSPKKTLKKAEPTFIQPRKLDLNASRSSFEECLT
jgi:hypothetical protein